MKRILYITFILLLSISTVFAADELSKVGTTMVQFLKIGVSGRGTAMGNAYVAGANDVSALVWNPAGIQQIGKRSFGISHTQLYAGITHNFVGISMPLDGATSVGFSLVNLNSGDIEVTTIEEPQGTGEKYTTSDLMVGFSVARRLTDRFTLGVTFKYIEEKLYHEKASTIAFDIGSQFDTGIYGMRLGMALQNFGGKMQLDGSDLDIPLTDPNTGFDQTSGARIQTAEWPIPLIYRMGIFMDLVGPKSEIMQNSQHQFTIAMEANDPIDHYLRYNFGAEYEWNGMFALRGGYKLNYDEATYSFGAGFKFNMSGTMVQLDYSFNNYGLLDYVHQYSFSFAF
ncbi:MAG: hypothetical protein Kow0037_15510 [Calditrichia bacterium]